MTQTFALPFGVLNAIPGISNIEDVEIEVLEPDDVVDAVTDATISVDDVVDGVREELDDVADELVDELERQVPEVSVPGAEQVADAVLDRLEVEPGLFGPIEQPLDVLFQEAVEEALGNLGELDASLDDLDTAGLTEVPSVIDDVQADIQSVLDTLDRLEESVGDGAQIDFPNVERVVTEALADAEPSVNGAGFFSDPVGFVVALGRAAVKQAVSEDAAEELRDVLD